ncbi:hypothetical protein AB0L06_27775 [Spirillospora sp. NPDC052269]
MSEALVALADEPGVVQSVLAGDVRPATETKLAAFGLDEHLDFEAGAYGSDDAVRPRLVAVGRGSLRGSFSGVRGGRGFSWG